MTTGRARARGAVVGGLLGALAACGDPDELPCDEPGGASAELDRVPLRVHDVAAEDVAAEDVAAEVAASEDERREAWVGRRCDLDALLWVPEAVGPVGIELCGVEVAVDLAFLREGEVVATELDAPPCAPPCEACPALGEDGPAVDAVLWLPAGRIDVAVGDSVTGLDAVALPTG